MEENEIKLLQEIEKLRHELENEVNGHMHGRVYVQPSPYVYCQKAQKLVTLVKKLRDEYHADYDLVLDQHINSVYGKEIKYVEKKMTEQDENKVKESMIKANLQLDIIFNPVFQKVIEMKSFIVKHANGKEDN